MDARNLQTISLAGLALGISAASLMGTSGVAEADETGCLYGNACQGYYWIYPRNFDGSPGEPYPGYLFGNCDFAEDQQHCRCNYDFFHSGDGEGNPPYNWYAWPTLINEDYYQCNLT